MLFQCFSLRLATGTACPRGQCFSMLFNAFQCFFNAFQCFFNAFGGARYTTEFYNAAAARGNSQVRSSPGNGLPPAMGTLACTWAQGNSQVRSGPGTACHGLAWARSPRRGAHLDPHPCARSPKRARTLPEPCSSTAGHALRRKTHSRMLRTRFHEIICDSTP